MKIMAVYGNPKSDGFVHGCLDAIAERLENRGAEVDKLKLAEMDLHDCTGCFACLRTGECVIDDDVAAILDRLRAADALVCGASVRNGYMTALFKRFYERMTYTFGFTGEASDKYVLGVSAVGLMGGRKATRRIVAMADMGARVVDHLFFRTGIPTRLRVDDVKGRLIAATDKLHTCVVKRLSPGLRWRVTRKLDRAVMIRFMFNKNPDVYANVIQQWRRRGWMK
jgi:multimeric flavodoxin WrbA